jgi:hypothetical protein
VNDTLPALLDCKALQRELGGVPRGVAEALMRDLEKIRIGRRVFVRRTDVHDELERRTLTPAGFPKGEAA